ncbi:MAG: FAD-dependent oxidoreductase [Firmicutes bacterium]|nr:FAD-dependent oxidoreductase [Bacillota bacterium]
MSTNHYQLVIFGAGPSGLTAALYACRAGLKVAIIEKNMPGGQMNNAETIENYPGIYTVTGAELSKTMLGQAESLGATMYYGAGIIDLQSNPKKLLLEFDTISFDNAILAFGTSNKSLGLKGEDELVGSGISYCVECDGAFFKNKSVMVVGSGKKAADAAAYLKPLVKNLHLVSKSAEITALYGNPLKAVTVTNENKKTQKIEVQGLFVVTGHEPNSFPVRNQVNMDEKGYIIIDEKCKTNLDGVYAVGDVRKGALKQIVTACADGAIAGVEVVKKARGK